MCERNTCGLKAQSPFYQTFSPLICLSSASRFPPRRLGSSIARVLLADLLLRHKRDQRSQGAVYALRIREPRRDIGVKQNHLLQRIKTLPGDRAVCMTDMNRVSLLRSKIIFASRALLPLEIIFREHVVIKSFRCVIRLLHINFFQVESPCDN